MDNLKLYAKNDDNLEGVSPVKRFSDEGSNLV